ncbi:MAG: hypothetical protein QXV69_07500 [Sulfolobaceae archaeon]
MQSLSSIKVFTRENRYQILTKIYNLPKFLGEINNGLLYIIFDDYRYLFRILFFINNEYNFKFIFENKDGKIILDFEIKLCLEKEGYEVHVRLSTTSNKLLDILNYIKTRLNYYLINNDNNYDQFKLL